MKDLIEKLEAAETGSRELDAEILTTLGTHVLEKRARDQKAWWYEVGGERYDRLDPNPYSYRVKTVPRYTTSIDAALSGERVTATLLRANGKWYAQALDKQNVFHTGEANTEALARRIAALKAREAKP